MHKGFSPLFGPTTPEEYKTIARENLVNRLSYVAGQLAGRKYLMGEGYTVADGYLFTVLNWGQWVGIDIAQWPTLAAYQDRIASRTSVREALAAEAANA